MNNSTNNQNGKNKPVTREELDLLIKDAQKSNDWSKVESANVSEITDMSHLFRNLKVIQDLDLSSWDTSNVTNVEAMFFHSNYNHPLNFDTSNVIDMSCMFSSSPFNQNISDWVIQDTEENQDVIEYRDECIKIRKEREAIDASVENNSTSTCGLKL